MKRELHPAKQIAGKITVPGDKSMAHRAALLSILASDTIRIKNFPDSADCQRSLDAAQAFGVEVKAEQKHQIVLYPPNGRKIEAGSVIDCGNSGTTARLLAGIAAGLDTAVVIAGDESLSRRPMDRIAEPLTAMGAELIDTHGHLPLTVYGRKLLPFEYRLPVPSAQVKSAVLLAGLASGCSVTVREETLTRDHTELMLAELGAAVNVRDVKPVVEEDPHDPRKKRRYMPEPFKREITLASGTQVKGGEINLPGDFSTAAFFWTAAALTGGEVTVENVGLNPTRTAFLEHLKAIGCTVETGEKYTLGNEVRGDVTVRGGSLKGRKLAGEQVAGMIDELPLVAVLAAFSEGTSLIRDARELRYKESDRIAAIARNLEAMGVSCGVLEDGLVIDGKAEPNGADFATCGDHRIAMAFSVAALAAVGPSTIDDSSVVDISCPGFYHLLDQIKG